MNKLSLLLSMYLLLSSCAPLYYGVLPGTDYKYLKPLEHIDLGGKAFNIQFQDKRNSNDKIECSKKALDRNTELEGDLGFQYFREYVKTMIEESNGQVDHKSNNKIILNLEGLSFKLIGAFYIVPHGLVQFKASSPFHETIYCSDMTDLDDDAPLNWYAANTRKTMTRLIVSGSMRRAIESFIKDLKAGDIK